MILQSLSEFCILSPLQALWKGMYLRWLIDLKPDKTAARKAQEIVRRNKEVKYEVTRQRKQLRDLLEEAEMLGLFREEVIDQDESTGDRLVKNENPYLKSLEALGLDNPVLPATGEEVERAG